MPPLVYLPIVLFAAVIANDWLLARKIRKAVESRRLKAPGLEDYKFGGSPIGLVVNLFRLRKIPATDASSDPDHVAILRYYRGHQILVALLGVSVVGILFLQAAR